MNLQLRHGSRNFIMSTREKQVELGRILVEEEVPSLKVAN